MSSPPAGEWSSPNITGQPLPPCSYFTLTPVGERRAALFGGVSGSGAISDDLIIVDLSRDTVVSVIVTYTVSMSVISQGSVCSSFYQHWTRINKRTILFRSVKWPERRYAHATTCVSGPLLVIVGGAGNRQNTISNCWIGDLTTKQWKKVRIIYVCIWHRIKIGLILYTFFSYPSLTL